MEFDTKPTTAPTGKPTFKSAPTKPTAAAAIQEDLMPKLDADADAEAEGAKEKSEEKKPAYTPEELTAVFDDILFAGEYTENVIIRGRLPVQFRTRTADEVSAISRIIDTTSSNLISTMNEQRSLLNLYYGLISYNNKDLSTIKFEDRQAFIKKLPAPIIGVLMTAMAKFDDKVYAACKEGEENF